MSKRKDTVPFIYTCTLRNRLFNIHYSTPLGIVTKGELLPAQVNNVWGIGLSFPNGILESVILAVVLLLMLSLLVPVLAIYHLHVRLFSWVQHLYEWVDPFVCPCASMFVCLSICFKNTSVDASAVCQSTVFYSKLQVAT